MSFRTPSVELTARWKGETRIDTAQTGELAVVRVLTTHKSGDEPFDPSFSIQDADGNHLGKFGVGDCIPAWR